MKALVWHGKEDIRCGTVTDPRIEDPRDVIVNVRSCAIRGSDLHLFHNLIPAMLPGDIMGRAPGTEGNETPMRAYGARKIGSAVPGAQAVTVRRKRTGGTRTQYRDRSDFPQSVAMTRGAARDAAPRQPPVAPRLAQASG